MRVARYFLSPAAKIDILVIRNYTMERWGKKQNERYTRQLQNRMRWLAGNPNLGKPREEIQHGLFSYQQGSHIIIYKQRGEAIEIARVLHQSMDIEQHLSIEKNSELSHEQQDMESS